MAFGKRSMQAPRAFAPTMPRPAPAMPSPAPAIAVAAPRAPAWEPVFPIVTPFLLVLLTLVFVWEANAAKVVTAGVAPSVASLIGFGAVDGAMVFGDWGWWRLLTAPLLHANLNHLISNGVVLAVIGFMLEPLIGPRWFAGLYGAGAIGGGLCSILLNAPDIPAVGASGAIMGVLAGAFLCGASHKAGPKGRRMQTWSLRLMLPALIPMAADSHVDYAGHLGGVVAGLLVGVVLQMAWPRGADRPEAGEVGLTIGAVVISGGVLALLLVPHTPASAAALRPSTLIPDESLPAMDAVTADQARDLVARYPHDPRAHLFRGFAFLQDSHDLADAEEQFRLALDPADLATARLEPSFEKTVKAMLALTVAYEHRPDEARALGGPLCGYADANLSEIAAEMHKIRICDD